MAPDRGDNTPKSSSRAWETLTPPLSSWILDAMASMNFRNMTPVQASTIPLFLGHKDVVVEAVTGSGKTLTFLIPLLERVLRLDEPNKKHSLSAIVISPTRELAQQIHQVLTSLLAFHPPSAAALRSLTRAQADEDEEAEAEDQEEQPFPPNSPYILPQLLLGGTSTPAQDLSAFLKFSPNVLIATPGRLLEILSSPYVHAPQSTFDLLILDEADRLLDLGFKDSLTRILSLLPKQRRTGLFSASVSEALDQIIRVGLRNPVRVAVKVKGSNGVQDKKTPASLKMTYLVTPTSHKFPAISQLLHTLQPCPLRTIIYLSTCASVDYFQHLLPAILPSHTTLIPLHGKHPSNVRQKNFTKFITSPTPTILLTTDVAARGLDIPQVDLVLQPDPPSDPKVFIHRCGRAGRAGRKGLSVILLTPGREEDYIPFLDVRKTPVQPLTPTITITPSAVQETTTKFRDIVLSDRAIHDKAQRAFPSFVQSYSKHQASSIFRLADLDWNDLISGWALLRIPKMPELKKYKGTLDPLPEINWDEYRYKDKQREKQRREMVSNPKPEGENAEKDRERKRKSTDAWSANTELKEYRESKRSKRAARKAHERAEKMTDEERRKEEELKRMIEKVREQNLASSKNKEESFEGFD